MFTFYILLDSQAKQIIMIGDESRHNLDSNHLFLYKNKVVKGEVEVRVPIIIILLLTSQN